ncbi:ankyrin repeat domain-containing protein [Photobacterium kishitanii]|uniref:ankyrin repeat domain-containing protein n=1 Tax=Photobacterium kishitanii TaxID=318456 RepID=UPI001F29AB7C|nr:ankyrin repeat domain-containing protein [Photobacterium kishitanii]
MLLSVTSDNKDVTSFVSDRLNSIFIRSGEEGRLDNILPTSEDDIQLMEKVIKEEGQHSHNYLIQLEPLVEKLTQGKAPFRQLQKVNDFEVVYGAMEYSYPNQNIWEMIIKRLHELEISSEQSMKRILLELEYHLLFKSFDSNTEGKINILINEAKNCDVLEYSRALVLRFEAIHLIAQNKLSEAEKKLNLAIDNCKKYSFGKLRGSLAKDAFSLAIANQKLIPNNHEKYFRDMAYWGGFEGVTDKFGKIDIYNVSRELHEYFWKELYKCYPSYQPLYASCLHDVEKFNRDFMTCIKDDQPIEQVLKKHKELKKKQLKYPQADSIMMLMMKVSYETLAKLSRYKHPISIEDINEIKKVSKSIIIAIRQVIELWPEIVNISDFKQQTPLMLAAHYNDYETVEVLLKAKADPNLHDFTGRTALHAAAASRCLKGASLILEHGCDATITTVEGATALHTATRMGDIPIVKLLIKKQPELLNIKDLKGILPEVLAKKIATDLFTYELLKQYLKSERRTVVSHENYKKMLDFF